MSDREEYTKIDLRIKFDGSDIIGFLKCCLREEGSPKKSVYFEGLFEQDQIVIKIFEAQGSMGINGVPSSSIDDSLRLYLQNILQTEINKNNPIKIRVSKDENLKIKTPPQ